MGIVNVTPDSFSDGGMFFELEAAKDRAHKLIAEGARIIDVGGESTRPGSDEVSIEEELRRTIPLVKALSEEGIAVSIDTRHVEVARAALGAGAVIINDISGFSDPAMQILAGESDVGLVVMHMQGTPKNMQHKPHYDDVVSEVYGYLSKRVSELAQKGIDPSRIIIDLGFGFGKTFEHNSKLYRSLFERIGQTPQLLGISRKRFLRELSAFDNNVQLDVVTAHLSAAPTLANSELVLRVHNVEQTAKALKALEPKIQNRCFLALGSNSGDRSAHLCQALEFIERLPQTKILNSSEVYETEPAYEHNQKAFYNAVIEVQTALPLWAFAHLMQSLEKEIGRVKTYENGPRIIDIDLLAFFEGDYMRTSNTPTLILPHPRIGERDFVLRPLMDMGVSPQKWGVKLENERIGKVVSCLGPIRPKS